MDWLLNFWQLRKQVVLSFLLTVAISLGVLVCGVYLVVELWETANLKGLIALAVLTIGLSVARN